MKTLPRIICILAVICFPISCGHEEHSHKPGEMNKKFLDPNLDVETWKTNFEDKDRDVIKHAQAIVDGLELKNGSSVADIGAGTGAHLSQLHAKVGTNGKVYAVELSPKFVEFMHQRAKNEGLTSVEVVQGNEEATNVPANSVDVVVIIDTYHHFDKPQAMLKDIYRILKPEGKLAIVDFIKIPGKSRQWIINHMRLDKKGYIEEISQGGFQFIEEKDIPFEEHFMVIFRKIAGG